MADMKKLLHTFDEADEILNDKIERTNLSTIVASATASVENKKTVLIRGTGRNIEVLKVGGKTVQNGTPTPTNPVEVKGVGDKSKNLYNYKDIYKSSSFAWNGDEVTGVDTDFINVKIPVTPSMVGKSCVFSATGKKDSNVTSWKLVAEIEGNQIETVTTNNNYTFASLVFTPKSTSDLIFISYGSGKGNITLKDFQVEIGSTPTPYIPYGKYKIPILTDGKSQNIYLDAPLFDGEIADLVGGKVEKKYGILKLTGDEDWAKTGNGFFQMTLPNKNNTNVRSNAFNQVPSWSAILNSTTYTCYSDTTVIYIKITDNTATVNDFKNWLKTISAYVVYELATPSIESFDGAVIPTSVGEQELELNTEITPSSIEAETFGSYYTKSEVDKFINDLDTRLKALEPSATSLD